MNMLRPSMPSMIKPNESCYEFVVAVAKRAREIAEECEEQKIILEEKPVKKAIEEFANGRHKVSGM